LGDKCQHWLLASSQLQASHNCKKSNGSKKPWNHRSRDRGVDGGKGGDGTGGGRRRRRRHHHLQSAGQLALRRRYGTPSPKSALLVSPIFLVGWLMRDWISGPLSCWNSLRWDVKLLPLCQLLQPLCLILSSVICMIRDWGFWGTGSWGTVESFSITVLFAELECFGLGLALG